MEQGMIAQLHAKDGSELYPKTTLESVYGAQGRLDTILGGKSDVGHTHPEKLDMTGGEMTGALVAGGVSDPSTPQVRNIYAGTTELIPGESALATGTIYVMYE